MKVLQLGAGLSHNGLIILWDFNKCGASLVETIQN
jgi:hypothetical protein